MPDYMISKSLLISSTFPSRNATSSTIPLYVYIVCSHALSIFINNIMPKFKGIELFV